MPTPKEKFTDQTEPHIEAIEALVEAMPDRGNLAADSQKIALRMALHQLRATIEGLEDSDFALRTT